MKGKRGVQKGEKRGKYNTPDSKQVRIKLDIHKELEKELEKEEGKTFSEKVKNILKRIDKQ